MSNAIDMLGSANSPVAPTDNKQLDSISSSNQATKEEIKAPEAEALSPKLAELARREKALRQRALEDRRRIEAERRSLDEQRKELEQIQQWKHKLVEDPMSVLNEAGVSYDRLTSQYLNQSPENAEFHALKQEIKALRAEQEASKNQYQKAQDQQYEQAKKQIRTEVSLLVDQDESFEAIRNQGDLAKDAVVELIEQTFNQQGYIMPIEEAVKEIEEYLIEQALSFARLKKVQSKLLPQDVGLESKEKIPVAEQKQPPMNTLSNRIAPSTTKPMSERERRERAILAFRGQLT